ncbi:flagellar biosynthesis protein FlhG [Caldicoprobacter guelmensis]|uniref:MinD/ParA family protein n=1 Tax=Caldicoprobacter guelmensis TaxID=1170224 RepID=UPI001FAE8175|nr:MinD/ParA family protein [Caldicoprobacter guelmensis]MBM7581400.1 flagellar biosynthesis protein FlhG [Caldicoprobacter guelmensis]
MDQAERLRQIVKDLREKRYAYTQKARIITVTSGKGGVGKTNFTLNCAIALNAMGYRTLIIDADFGLSNIDVMLGMIPKYNLFHVITHKKRIEEVITEGPCGIKFIAGGSGIWELINLSRQDMEILMEQLERLDDLADIIMIDTGAGVSEKVIQMILAANEAIVITTPEPTSVTDAYALVKSVVNLKKDVNFKLVVNRADSVQEANDVMGKFIRVAQRFLDVNLEPLGYMLYDEAVIRSTKQQKPFVLEYPRSHAARQMHSMAQAIVAGRQRQDDRVQGFKGYVNQLLKLFNSKHKVL